MFDIGFVEMMLIGVVALIVIGPERLPGVARTAGKYFGRLKRFMTTVKADVEQELRADELREILARQQEELNSLKDTISDAGKEIEEAGRELEKEAGALSEAGAGLAQDLNEPDEVDDDVSHADLALDDPDAIAADDAAAAEAEDTDAPAVDETEALEPEVKKQAGEAQS